MKKMFFCSIVFALLVCSYLFAQTGGGKPMTIELMSSAFQHGEMIPSKYTCDGDDISPPLQWANIPGGTMTFALISDDPDAPVGTWVHWVLFNIPSHITKLPENVPPTDTLENGAMHGITNFGRLGYGGPCPPSGTHRYYFKVYAVDAELSLQPGASKKDILEAMEGHILAQGELMGTYKRK